MQKIWVFISILSSVLGASLVWGLQTLTHKRSPAIVTLNIHFLMDEEIARAAQSKLTPQQAAEQVKQYGARLSKAIENVAQEQNLVILPLSAVMAGAVDVTPLIQKQIRNDPVH